jgi:hypothetical protein
VNIGREDLMKNMKKDWKRRNWRKRKMRNIYELLEYIKGLGDNWYDIYLGKTQPVRSEYYKNSFNGRGAFCRTPIINNASLEVEE